MVQTKLFAATFKRILFDFITHLQTKDEDSYAPIKQSDRRQNNQESQTVISGCK